MKHVSEIIPVVIEDLIKKAKANGNDKAVAAAEKLRGEEQCK